MKILQNFKNLPKSLIEWAVNAFDIRDFFVFFGLALLGRGLFLVQPWACFVVVGSILIYMGLFHGMIAILLTGKAGR